MDAWLTFGISILSGGFALAGAWLKGRLDDRTIKRREDREDQQRLRERYVELLELIERQGRLLSVYEVSFARIISEGGPAPKDDEPFELAQIRALIFLYFPQLSEALKKFDETDKALGKKLTEDLEEKKPFNIAAMSHIRVRNAAFNRFAQEARNSLDKLALGIR